ncbi:hypothetical protein WEH80_06355 [Actinomycetes bacterium KLBMP 9759]
MTTVRPGVYLDPDDPRLRDPVEKHEVLTRTTIGKIAPDSVVSHASAAVLHRLPLWQVALGRVHVTRNRRNGGRVSALLHVHTASLSDDEVVVVDGVAVTSVARTIVDLACTESVERALVPADAALHRHLTSPELLLEQLDRCANRSGIAGARRVIEFADAGATSPGETRSRLAIHRAGLPAPVLQQPIAGTTSVVDFWWPAFRTVGEFDGMVKYGVPEADGTDVRDVVVAEKLREDRIRSMGISVVRWVWNELPPHFAPVAARIRAAFTAG